MSTSEVMIIDGLETEIVDSIVEKKVVRNDGVPPLTGLIAIRADGSQRIIADQFYNWTSGDGDYSIYLGNFGCIAYRIH